MEARENTEERSNERQKLARPVVGNARHILRVYSYLHLRTCERVCVCEYIRARVYVVAKIEERNREREREAHGGETLITRVPREVRLR